MPSVFDFFTGRVDEVTAQLVALQLPLSLPAGPPAPDDPWAVPRPAVVDRTTLAWSTAVLMLTHYHRTPLANQIPSADALLRELGVRGLADLHRDLNDRAPIDYRFTRCPYCDGLGEDPTLPTCQDLGCPSRHEHDGHPHLCPVCHGEDYQPQWHAEQHMAAMEKLLADAIKDKTTRHSWGWPWPHHRSPGSHADQLGVPVPDLTGCVFCRIAAGQASADIVREWDDALVIRPRGGGVNDGHVLVLPRVHVADAGTNPDVTATVMRRAAELMAEHPAANIITSKGALATQTVFHLHVHLVPRVAGDDLPLPWTPPAHLPRRRAYWSHLMTVTLVMAREPLPATGPSVFLAGPTPDGNAPVPSWRPAALDALTAQWTGTQPLTVLSPESRGGKRANRYEDQVDWETDARAAADAILFWIPRDLKTMPGMTTNVEFGLDVGSGRAVLGCPTDCPNPERNRYLTYVARRHGVPVLTTLHHTVAAALTLITATAPGPTSS